MITLKKDNTFVYFDDWNELLLRPQFRASLDDTKHTLKEILGRYHEQVKRHCGLQSCNTPHNRGYVVSTEEGLETNIGKDCGTNFFGVEFGDQAIAFDREVEDQQRRLALWGLRSRSEQLLKDIELFRRMDYGADWVHHWIGRLCSDNSNGIPTVRDYLRRVLRDRNPSIFVERDATEVERVLNKEKFVRESYGNLESIEALFPENDLRKLVIIELGQGVQEFEGAEIDKIDRRTLANWAQWAGTVDGKWDAAQRAHGAGVSFLALANLEKFLQILNTKEAAALRAVIASIRKSNGKLSQT